MGSVRGIRKGLTYGFGFLEGRLNLEAFRGFLNGVHRAKGLL